MPKTKLVIKRAVLGAALLGFYMYGWQFIGKDESKNIHVACGPMIGGEALFSVLQPQKYWPTKAMLEWSAFNMAVYGYAYKDELAYAGNIDEYSSRVLKSRCGDLIDNGDLYYMKAGCRNIVEEVFPDQMKCLDYLEKRALEATKR